jgi:hypothetical protein
MPSKMVAFSASYRMVDVPTGGSGAWLQLSSPWYADSRPALLTMVVGIWLGPVMVVLFATVTPPPVV